ncbi:MAG: hypothetical protein CL871_00480 [Cytophagia bacterium]|nr:hypothetical protein [Cytophagia bacterium]
MASFTVLSRELILSPSSFLALELLIFFGKLIIFSIDSLVKFSKPGKIFPLISAALFKKDKGKSERSGKNNSIIFFWKKYNSRWCFFK